LDTCYKDPKTLQFGYQQFIKFWSKIEKTDIKFLEYGGGATISRLITTCSHVQDIIFAEYLETNREAFEAWIDKDPKAYDWQPILEFIVQDLEGKGQGEVAKREDELRQKIRAIVPCDIKADNILEIPSNLCEKYGTPYDVVATSNCLEAVLASEQEYKDVVKKLAKLVKPGGYLVMHGVLHETCYFIGSNKFSTLTLNKGLVIEGMKNAGLKEIDIELASSDAAFNMSELSCNQHTDASDFYFVYGRV
jgi:hypothetical protein